MSGHDNCIYSPRWNGRYDHLVWDVGNPKQIYEGIGLYSKSYKILEDLEGVSIGGSGNCWVCDNCASRKEIIQQQLFFTLRTRDVV